MPSLREADYAHGEKVNAKAKKNRASRPIADNRETSHMTNETIRTSTATADALMQVFGLTRTGYGVEMPIATPNPVNGSHQHWRTVNARRKKQRETAKLLTPARWASMLPARILLVRLSAGTLDDDNLRPALKSVRDGVADGLGIADNDPRVTWDYAQERCKRGQTAVRVECYPADAQEAA